MSEKVVYDEGGMKEIIKREPLGVIANISAWNYPYFVGINVLAPALLTGNSVLYKPSEFASMTGIKIVSLLKEAGFGASIQYLIGSKGAGQSILKTQINGIFFTGSYLTGKHIAEAVSGRMIKTQLELGGKDPVYVHKDVDIKSAAESLADGSMYNGGQSCCSVERIYVHESIYDEFVSHFVKTVKSYKIGDPLQEDVYFGPLTRESHLDFLEGQIKDALLNGAKLLCGGKRIDSQGNYFEPTVLVNVNNNMDVMVEESFGPIIGIQKVETPEEAVNLMNHTPYGLTAGIYTKDKDFAMNTLKTLDAGSVYWNCCDRVSPRLPWSGRRHSGIGLTLSTEGITTFTQTKGYHLKE